MCSSNGKTPGDEEKEKDPDSWAKRVNPHDAAAAAAIHVSTLGGKANDATYDVENTKHRCYLGIVGIFDVRLLIGCLHDVDHLVRRVGNTLLHL